MSNVPPPTGGPVGPPPSGGPGGPPPYNPTPVPAASSSVLSATWNMTDPAPQGWQPKQKLVAGLLGIFLGGWGVHSFYLGNTKKGVIQLVVSLVTCGIGGIWGFIEGILILIGNDNTLTDAYGYPLTE